MTRKKTRIRARAMIQPNRARNTIHPRTSKIAVMTPALWGLYHAPSGSVWNAFQQQEWLVAVGLLRFINCMV